MKTTKRVICRNADNSFSVCSIAYGFRESKPMKEGENLDDYLLRVAQEDCPGYDSYRVVELEDIPDRRWRSAWRDDGVSISVDLPAARLVRMDELKIIRSVKRAEKREEYEIALADAGNTDDILSTLKSMNNMEVDEVQNLDAQETLENIANYLPTYLQ